MKAAADGDTIDVHGDGPHLERRVEIRGKRSRSGRRPVLTRPPTRDDRQVRRDPVVNTDSDLTLEGLDIHRPVVAGRRSRRVYSHSTVGKPRPADRPRLSDRVRRQSMCVLSGGGELVIEGSHLVADGGIAVGWKSVPGGSIRVARSTIEAESGFFMSFPPADAPKGEPVGVEFTDNTVLAKGVWGFAYPAAPKHTVRFEARRNLVSATYLFGVPTRTATAADAPAALRRLVVWTEEDNVYDRRGNFLAAIKLRAGHGHPSGSRRLDDWAAFWKGEAGRVD